MRGRRLREVLGDRPGTGEIWEAYRRVERGEWALVDPSPPRSVWEYLSSPGHSLWLYALAALLAASAAAVAALPPGPARLVAAGLLVLFLPGYALQELLHPREGDLEPVERLAYSIALSAALAPLVGLALNYSPWGIRLGPYLAVDSALTLALALAAAWRKARLLRERRVPGGLQRLG